MRSCTLLILLATAGCVTLTPEVQHGTAAAPTRVAFLAVTCSSVDGACDPAYAQGVRGIVNSELSFSGLTVIDAKQLVAAPLTHTDAAAAVDVNGAAAVTAAGGTTAGSSFEDLPPQDRRTLLEAAHVDGVVTVQLVVGARDGLSPVRHNEVLIRLQRGDQADLVWATRCQAMSGLNPPIDQAFAKAARCALAGVLKTTSPDVTESMF